MTLLVHIVAGGLGLIFGFVALYAAKGARLHRKSGMLFVYAMVTMGITGAVIAALRGVESSVIAGLLTAYLVITALTTMRPASSGSRRLDLGAMLMALALGLTSVTLGYEALTGGNENGKRDGVPPVMFFIFGAVALLASVGDLRMMRSSGLQGAPRLARHLWRMCFALWIAASSFFLGQADEFPKALQIPGLLAIPAFLPLLVMFYWLWRVRTRRTSPAPALNSIGEKMRTLLPALLICLLAPAAALAQGNPLSEHNKMLYGGTKDVLLRSAEKVPEEFYGFKPTEVVRSYGQIVGHIADSQYRFCSIMLGEKNPAPNVEKTKTAKTDLIAALKEAFAYCDKAYGGLTDASASQMVKFFGRDTPKLGVLNVNNLHNAGHYENLVTYMRLKDIVPPTSEPGFSPIPKK
ncbi:MAG: hypothetical protein QOH06_5453 [Acidobacteriota bacterium]|jgi:uncharacterized membrane protein/uncharacterized damage-inducible protein DinB|nr:hypothetical protein [Acidobacteriota bacterium]